MNGDSHPESLAREETIFHAALLFPDPARRAAYLDLACEEDIGLRARIDRLLALEPKADGWLEPPLPQIIGEPAAATPSPAEVIEERIGRYRLLEKIGEGGMGVVYMAEQREPITRKVALKVIKLGMDTRQVVARFEAERQALALMDHPNIAKILDA
ncbi:MAG TPA: serine/threonine protein kinase, partial [Verrucomicrobiota bacterium]|nr:serine/threonine protein kinase [Verrucomicrobiota bacterium]